jgi:hypothetical protein
MLRELPRGEVPCGCLKPKTFNCLPNRGNSRLLVTSAALDTEVTTQTPRLVASRASSQKKASQKQIENDDEKDCAKNQRELEVQLRYVKHRAFPCPMELLKILCEI